MALTMNELQALLDEFGLKYFMAPGGKPVLMCRATGAAGSYQLLITLQDEGQFLQLLTVGLLHCPRDHRHYHAVLEVLARINHRKRFVKLGWDSKDGEVVMFGDAWIKDGTLTQGQVGRMLKNFFPSLDSSYGRLKKTMETGKDPGEDDFLRVLQKKLKDLTDDDGPSEI